MAEIAWPWFGMIWHKGLWCREWMRCCMEHLFFLLGVLNQTCPLWNSQEFPNKKLGFIQTKYYRNVGWTNILLCYLCPFFHTLSVDFSIMLLTWAAKIWKTYINLYPTTVLHTYFWLHVIYKLSKIHLELYHYNDMYWFAAVAGISQIDQLCWGYVSVTGIWSSDGSHLDSAVVGPQTRLLASDAKFAAPAAWKINVREKQRSQRYDHLSMCSHVLEGHGWLIM